LTVTFGIRPWMRFNNYWYCCAESWEEQTFFLLTTKATCCTGLEEAQLIEAKEDLVFF